ncbi:MAG TPA: hypothetical protein DDZ89_16680 [Clostridiales bacterium]|nr:hypothetical protein [Clostridiales bacterium]
MKTQFANPFIQRISPGDGFYFFGYYDIPAFDDTGHYHLAHKVSFMDRLHQKGDEAQIGIIDIGTCKFECLDVTEAWNFQQGSMLQWNPKAPGREIIYNKVVDDQYVGVVMDIHTGKKRYLDDPVANVSTIGDYALGINMNRLYDFRPGYGYAHMQDRFKEENHSDDDGVFLICMKTGKSKLILSLQEIWDFSGGYFNGEDQKMVINHITFNTDQSRFLILPRNFPKPGERHKTAIITADLDGKELFLLSDYGIQSHYYWKNPETVIFFSDGKELSCRMGELNTYELKDRTYQGNIIACGAFQKDHHMSYSPDRKRLLSDSYPSKNGMRMLSVYDSETDTNTYLGSFHSLPVTCTDIRCDLHPRWNKQGSAISFDSTHEGFRGIYMMDLDR